MVSLNEVSTPPEAPPEAVKPRFGRKLYLVIGLVAIAVTVTASIIVFTQLLPSAKGEPVTLGLNYSDGEKMTYNISITTEAMGMEISQEGTWEMEVLSFDGENYTIRNTMTFDQQVSSYTMKMKQTGYVIEYIELPLDVEQMFSSFSCVPGFGFYFTEEEMRVGESWKIPIDIETPWMDLEGTISYKLSKITSVTVPAGTYEALKINIKSSGLRATMEEMDFHLTSNINGYIYLENATCHLIELKLDQSITMSAMGQISQTMTMTMKIQLIEHLK